MTGGIFRAQPLWSSAAAFDIWTFLVTSLFGQKLVFLLHCMVWSRGRHHLLHDALQLGSPMELCSWQERTRHSALPEPILPPPCMLGREDTWVIGRV